MAKRWTPDRFVTRRRVRVVACAAIVALSSMLSFGIAARKAVALTVNGETRTVQTYAMSVDRLLEQQGVDVKTHDFVDSSSGDMLTNHAVVTVRSAYQTTINIDGTEVPFWTVATSAEQLLGFFEQNEHAAAKVTVDIKNVYNQLTGGMVINRSGPVTVIADGKSSVAPDGKLPAASILDSKGIVLGKKDRVSIETDGGATVLRVKRVTESQTTKTVATAHGTQTVVDESLAPGPLLSGRRAGTGRTGRPTTPPSSMVWRKAPPSSNRKRSASHWTRSWLLALPRPHQAHPMRTAVRNPHRLRRAKARHLRVHPPHQAQLRAPQVHPRLPAKRLLQAPPPARPHRPGHRAKPRRARQAKAKAAPAAVPPPVLPVPPPAACGIRPSPRLRPMPLVPPRSVVGPDRSGRIWSGSGTRNPDGVGVPITPARMLTASHRPCRVRRWEAAGRMTALCR